MTDTVTPEQVWRIEQRPHRRATAKEIEELQAAPDAPHVLFACECGCAWWSAKNIALSSKGHYNGLRSIFYHGDEPECQCSTDRLVCVVPVDA